MRVSVYLCLLFVFFSPSLLALRSSTSLDFSWRFHLGDPSNQDLCPATSFSQNLTGYRCDGWAHQSAYQLTFEECRTYCCEDPTCAGYLFNGSWCLIGNDMTGCVRDNSEQNVGEARSTPASIVFPPSGGPQEVDYDDSNWDVVDVPHDFVVAQAPSPDEEWNHGYRPKNISWYRLSFTIPSDSQAGVVWLEFDGVYRSSDYWLNGAYLGHHASGYTSFRYRIDNFTAINLSGQNTLAVRVDPFANEGWWYEGGGIYRHVRLITTSHVHIKPWSTYITSNVAGDINPSALTANAAVHISLEVENTSPSQAHPRASSYNLQLQILDPSGAVVWNTTSTSLLSSADVVTFDASLSNATLWHVGLKGRVYKLVVQVFDAQSGELLDTEHTTFGIRKVVLDAASGLILNDQKVKVKGMCNHQDFAGLGTAMPYRVNRFRVEKQQSFGVNAWRMSHNPPNPELLDITDDLGLMVWDENRLFGEYSQWYTDLRDMILRDRNHPSIIWWSLCNEFGCMQANMDVTVKVGKKFRDALKQLDPSRPISGAWNGNLEEAIIWSKNVVDMMGINYAYQFYDPFHSQQPNTALISSESCSCTSDRSYAANDTEANIGPYHAWSCLKDCWQPVATRDFVMGSFDWTGFDYRGEETPTVWPSVNSHFGVIDLAGFEKDAFFYYKGYYMPDAPLVHIVPSSWNVKSSVRPVPEISLNDCVANKSSPAGLLQLWKFDFQAHSSTLESVGNPGQCIKAVDGYPGHTDTCNPSDSAFLFSFDSHHGTLVSVAFPTLCLDVYQGTGPVVGFYPCQGDSDLGQRWAATVVSNNTIQFVSMLSSSGDVRKRAVENALVPGGRVSAGSARCLTDSDGSTIPVWIYTNGDSVELFLNGDSLGKQNVEEFEIAQYSVPTKPGQLLAVAYKSGNTWATETQVTSSKPVAIKLEIESIAHDTPFTADGQDVTMLIASVVDSTGLPVTDADNLLTIQVSGAGVLSGVGNGNPSNHYADKGNTIRLWNGLARVIVRSKTTPGAVHVEVSSPGLPTGTLDLMTVPRSRSSAL